MGVVGKQHQRSQTSRANRIAFGHSLGGVAHSVKRIGDVTNTVWELGHFGNATSVIGDGAIGVQGDHDASHAQHGGSRDGDAIQATEVKGAVNRSTHKQHWPSGGAHGYAQAGNDVGAVTCGRRLSNVLHRRVLGAGVVLGNPNQSTGQDQTNGTGAEQSTGAQGCAIGQCHRRGKERLRHKVKRDQ